MNIPAILKCVLIPCVLSFTITYCTKKPIADPAPLADTTYKWLALGDSYTIGESVLPAERYPVQAVKRLAEENIRFETPEIIARTGWTTANLLDAVQDKPFTPQYDLVTLLIGVNNQYQRRPSDEYATEFIQLLQKAVRFAGNRSNRVIVLSVPDYAVTPFARGGDTERISREIDQFNAINKKITQEAGIAYVDITPASRTAASDPSLIASDSLHFSGKAYGQWADMLVPVIKNALRP
ncbi:MAG: SGNH/GDSL hydrolase family protein [Chitinophagaceae bacterium]